MPTPHDLEQLRRTLTPGYARPRAGGLSTEGVERLNAFLFTTFKAARAPLLPEKTPAYVEYWEREADRAHDELYAYMEARETDPTGLLP